MKYVREFETERLFKATKKELEEPYVALTNDDDLIHIYMFPFFQIMMNDQYDDLALIPLNVKKQGIDETTVWSHNLGDDMATIDGTTLRLLKHYEGEVKLTATAGEYTDEKVIEITCSAVPSTIEYRVVTPPSTPTVDWNITSTELSFIGEITAKYAEEHKPDEVTQSTYTFTAEFSENTPQGDNPMTFTANTEMVDLGLPSGLKWAKCNIGAQTETDNGAFFQYGDINGYAIPTDKGGLSTLRNITNSYMWNGIEINYTIKQNGLEHRGFSWYNAPFNNGETSYDASYFETIIDDVCPNGVLSLDYDAAHTHMGNGWRIPTRSDIDELFNNTTYTYQKNFNGSGINGWKFTNNNDSSKYIFIPLSGVYLNVKQYNYNKSGYYWSNSLHPSNHNHSYYMYINDANKVLIFEDGNRADGFPIRGVYL